MDVEFTDLDGVAKGRAENLREAGYESVEDLTDADAEEMADQVSYLPEDTALSLIVQAQNIVEEEKSSGVSESQPVTEEVSEAIEEVEEIEEEVEAEMEEDTEEDVDEGEDDGMIEFGLTFDSAMQYDVFFDAVMSQRSKMIKTNRHGIDPFNHALDQMRSSDGVGSTIELEMDEGQLNDLHNCIRQTMIQYKGDNLIDQMDAMKEVLNDINEVRDENLF